MRVLSVFEFNSTAYMVMRFEEGGTLSSLLDRRGMLPEADLLRVLLPILDGLELVHGAGFIHRDIKPDNIHIRGDGSPVLLDLRLGAPVAGQFDHAHDSDRARLCTLRAVLQRLVEPGAVDRHLWPRRDLLPRDLGRAPLDAVSRSKGVLGSTQEVLVPASVVGAGRYSGRFLVAIDHALAFAEKDRPQTIASWRQELISGPTPPPAATEIVAAPPSSVRPSTGVSSSSAVASELAAGAIGPNSTPQAGTPAEVHDPKQPAQSGDRRSLIIIIVAGITVVGVAIAAYIATVRAGDETRSTVAKLQKQLLEKERAEAERVAKQQADEEARKRQDQLREQDKIATESATKREAEQKRQEEQKRRDTTPAKQLPKNEPGAKPSSGTTIAKASPTPTEPTPRAVPAPQPAAPANTQPLPAPEAPKPSSPPTPREQLADADRVIAAKQFAEGLAILRPLAEAGNAKAQMGLGNAYAQGLGVSKDYAAARDWYDRAARQGEIGAALKLGAMYANGTGVDTNNYLAYVYYGMAARLGAAAAKPEMERAASSLQPAERRQADHLIDSKMPKKE